MFSDNKHLEPLLEWQPASWYTATELRQLHELPMQPAAASLGDWSGFIPAGPNKMVPIWLLLDTAALCTIKTGCHEFSVLAARSQRFTLYSLLAMVRKGFLMAGCTWAPVWLAAPVRALLSPGPASLGCPAQNQVKERELNKLPNYFQACFNRV